MGYLQRLHFEHGEQHAELTNIDASPPVTDEVTNTDAYSGSWCQHWVFASSDDVLIKNDWPFTRAAVGTPVLIGAAVKIDDLADFDILAPIAVGIPSDESWVVARIRADGSVQAELGTNLALFNLSGSVGASLAGVITAGQWHYISMRVVFSQSAGEVQVAVDGAEVINETGLDTVSSASPPANSQWGWGALMEVRSGGAANVWMDDIVLADDLAAPFKPQMHEAIVPDGVTASNDGTVFGGAADAAAATDEIPGTSADGFTLDAVNNVQGLTFGSRTGLGTITGVQVWGQVGDQAVGSEELTCDLSDGVATAAGSPVQLGASFTGRPLTELLNAPPSGGSWDDTLLDAVTVELERTA